MNRRIILSLLFFLCVSSFLGCGGAEEARRMQACRLLGLQYHEFYAANQRGPKDVDEFQAFKAPAMSGLARMSDEGQNPIFKEIEDGEFVFVWNAVMFDNGNEGDKHVLAYEKSAPESGGIVIMGGGFVDRLSAEEFAKLELMPTAEQEPVVDEKE